ncbi:hypothetical protein AGABI2DRAFT_122386 [Agaricus bisporus var. bisporus H97]|uniref:hypothetical protein n=1 Tax=Agaricus bisporus var. bisporus (strain H97 / ATCC MYA-4626 / FGSC 10389) TaxID=936046 RepID=UPI00029F79A5|nr:hypothetical protein AGABI2DRAFT_122386 [Agaricus bisporus var. bisporus H97]EKV42802.1 hypothetical protein AGABI2DRAFT_122386 [Agaricus bisporus var. bisporus H97]
MSGFGEYTIPRGTLECGGIKLVNDADHPLIPPKDGDIHGFFLAWNTLINHSLRTIFPYFNRTCIESPSSTIHAAMKVST